MSEVKIIQAISIKTKTLLAVMMLLSVFSMAFLVALIARGMSALGQQIASHDIGMETQNYLKK
ncbi:hypothetical protein KKH39_02005 [Patescibacteria group bacterium]|nr:hypothetical protein [Patescibacteria group bacterium]